MYHSIITFSYSFHFLSTVHSGGSTSRYMDDIKYHLLPSSLSHLPPPSSRPHPLPFPPSLSFSSLLLPSPRISYASAAIRNRSMSSFSFSLAFTSFMRTFSSSISFFSSSKRAYNRGEKGRGEEREREKKERRKREKREEEKKEERTYSQFHAFTRKLHLPFSPPLLCLQFVVSLLLSSSPPTQPLALQYIKE